MTGRYSPPVPGGRVGRTDQGVDISAPAGTPVYAIADEQLQGVIPNWFRGQPFYWFRILGTNTYNYVAEQFRSGLHVGQTVRAGQQIGTVAPSGTGLELGFARDRSAAASGHPTPGYREGQATPLGQRYRAQVIGGGGGADGPAEWLRQAGFAPNLIPVFVAIGGAESRWNVGATHTNSDGTTDDGWLQINSSHGFDRARLLSDPVYTARAGKQVYGQQGLGAWTTYASGAYKAFMGQSPSDAGFGRTRPGGDPGPSAVDTELAAYFGTPGLGGGFGPLALPGDPTKPFRDAGKAISGVSDFLKWIAWIFHPLNILRVVEFWVGFSLVLWGFIALGIQWMNKSPIIREATKVVAKSPTPVGRVAKLTRTPRRLDR